MNGHMDKDSILIVSVHAESRGMNPGSDWYLCVSLSNKKVMTEHDTDGFWFAHTRVDTDIFDHEDRLKKLVENLIMEKMTALMENPVIFLGLPKGHGSFRFLVWRRI